MTAKCPIWAHACLSLNKVLFFFTFSEERMMQQLVSRLQNDALKETISMLPIQFEVIRTQKDAYQPGAQPITFDETLYNIGGAWDEQKGSFVAPEDGLYEFELDGHIYDIAVNVTINLKYATNSKLKVLERAIDVLPEYTLKNSGGHTNFITHLKPALRRLSSVVTTNLKSRDEIYLRQETNEGFYFRSDGTARLRFSGRKINV
jgi:hypothetical protein